MIEKYAIVLTKMCKQELSWVELSSQVNNTSGLAIYWTATVDHETDHGWRHPRALCSCFYLTLNMCITNLHLIVWQLNSTSQPSTEQCSLDAGHYTDHNLLLHKLSLTQSSRQESLPDANLMPKSVEIPYITEWTPRPLTSHGSGCIMVKPQIHGIWHLVEADRSTQESTSHHLVCLASCWSLQGTIV